ncbi:MAG: hypothetical protein R2755_02535 [Acidimicrobiales bacterium]
MFDFNYAILALMGLVLALAGVATIHGCWLGGLLVVFLQDFAPRIVSNIPFVDVDVVYAQSDLRSDPGARRLLHARRSGVHGQEAQGEGRPRGAEAAGRPVLGFVGFAHPGQPGAHGSPA